MPRVGIYQTFDPKDIVLGEPEPTKNKKRWIITIYVNGVDNPDSVYRSDSAVRVVFRTGEPIDEFITTRFANNSRDSNSYDSDPNVTN